MSERGCIGGWLASRSARLLFGVVTGVVCVAGTAGAFHLRAGDIVVTGDGHLIPSKLPQKQNAPVKLRMHGRMATASGELPPVLEKLRFEFPRQGAIETTGLPVCGYDKLEATTVPQARKLCPGAIIGRGTGQAIVKFPEQGPIDISSPLTFFNGPSGNGSWTVFFHAYTTVPAPATILFPITLEKIDNGPFGYLVEAEIPRISGGYGIPLAADMTLGRRWNFMGKQFSYLNARCETGRLQVRGEFSFRDGTVLQGSFLKRCQGRP
jgi:hypothetical protein